MPSIGNIRGRNNSICSPTWYAVHSPEVKFYLTMKLLHPSTHKPLGNIVFWKKNLLEIQLSIFHKMGSAYIHICLTSTTGKITYNRGIFRIKTVHTLRPLVAHNHSSSPFIQLILMVLCVYDLGRQTGWRASSGFLQRRLSDEETWCRQSSYWSEEEKKKKGLCPLVVIPCRV